MADDDLSLKFGAEIAGVIGALNQMKGSVKDFADQAKSAMEKVVAPFQTFQNLLVGIASIVAGGAMFKDIIESTTGLSSEVNKLQRSMGLNINEANDLAASLRYVGIESGDYMSMATKLDRQIRTMSASMREMGFTAKDLDLGQKGLMDKAIAKLLEYKEGVDRNIAAQVLFGRNADAVMGMLRLSLDGMTERAKELRQAMGLVVTQADRDRAVQYRIATTEMSIAFDGIKKVIGEAVLPYLTKFAQWFTAVAPGLISGMKETVKAVVEFAFNFAEGFVKFAYDVTKTLFNIYATWTWIKEGLGLITKEASMAATGNLAVMLDKFRKFRDGAVESIQTVKSAMLAPSTTANVFDKISEGYLKADKLLKNKEGIEVAMKGIDQLVGHEQAALERKKIILEGETDANRITQDQKFAALEAYTDKSYQAEKALLQRKLALIPGSEILMRANVNAELAKLNEKHNTEMVKLDQQSVAAQRQIWEGYLGNLTSAFNSQLRGLLQGTVTWTQALKNMLLDLTVKAIEMVEQWALKWAAGEIAKTTATTTGAATRAAEEVAAMEATLPLRIAKFTSDITARAAETFAGIFANLAPIMGPAAAGPAGAGAATVLAQLAAVPKLAVGTPLVLSDGLAFLHKGERVDTAAQVAAPDGGRGEGHTFNITLQGPASQADANMIVRTIKAALRTGQLSAPAGAMA